MKNSILVPLLMFFCTTLFSQAYFTAGGLRLGDEFGITVQQKVLKFTTVEGILQSGFRNKNTSLTVLLEQHKRLITKGLNFYLGAGVHKTWLDQNLTDPLVDDPFGVTVVLGGEFTLGRLNLSLDYKPQINVWGGQKDFVSQGALSARYVLVKRIKKKKKKQAWKFWQKDRKNKHKKKKNGGLFKT